MAGRKTTLVRIGWKLGKRRSGLRPGQCTKCRKSFPLTKKFFYVVKRRGRKEFRQHCKRCWAAQVARYQKTETYLQYVLERRERPAYRELLRAAWRKFHAKPEYKKYDRALYKRLMATPEGHEKLREKVRRRRARINGATRHHKRHDIRIAMEMQQGRCFYCDADVLTEYTVEHLIPLVRGGSDGPENIVVACAGCNFRKADKTPEEFVARIKHDRKRWRETRIAMGGVALMWGRRHS